MAISTNRNNIKPMFWFITVPVMVLLCLCGTVMALQGIRTGQFADSDSLICAPSCFYVFGMPNTIMFVADFPCDFAFFALCVGFLIGFALLSLSIRISARFTTTLETTFSIFAFVKFRKWFDFFAFGTSFGYNWFSHSLFLYKRLRLEPVVGHLPIAGSLYYMPSWRIIK